jgi:trans-2,3-dihydro-3-hydroxyanthranilate isomerase
MRYRFLTCDVFTTRRFGGNQLAVLPEADGLDTAAMQRLAAEFNYSETTFVLPPADPANLARVRIFTPRFEMPFAGHPTVGTALALAWLGRTPPGGAFVLEENAGPVPVQLATDAEGRLGAEFTAPAAATHSAPLDAAVLARSLRVEAGQIVTGGGLPCIASCGAPFSLVELASRDALAALAPGGIVAMPAADAVGMFLFTRDGADGAADLHARMFAPDHGVQEDPATGSAAAALAGFLAGRPGLADGWHGWRIAQGVEMGRPSLIATRALRRGGQVAEVRVAGTAVPVAEGTIEADW